MKNTRSFVMMILLFFWIAFSAFAQMMNQGGMDQSSPQRNQSGSGGHGGGMMDMMSMMGMMDDGMMSGGMMSGMMGGDMMTGRPDSAYMLRFRDTLGLTAEQVEKVKALNLELIRTESQALAAIRIGTAELDVLLSAKTVAMPQVEQKVRDIQTQRGNLLIAQIRYAQAARALLTPEQLRKFDALGIGRVGVAGESGSGASLGSEGPSEAGQEPGH